MRVRDENYASVMKSQIIVALVMLVAGGVSVTFAMQEPLLRLAAVGFMALGCATVLSIRACRYDGTTHSIYSVD